MQLSRGFFNQQRDTVLANLKSTKALTKSSEPLFDLAAEIERLAILFAPVMRDEIAEAGTEAMLLVTAQATFDITDTTIADFIAGRTNLVSTAINQETDKQLRAELADGIAKGESIDELAARIERVYGAAAGYRAERIARTETIRAENFASQESWRQSGLVERKEWYTAHDERVCQWCGPMDGRVIELNATYFDKGDTFEGSKGGKLKLDFDDVGGAPLHVNCRCTLLPVID